MGDYVIKATLKRPLNLNLGVQENTGEKINKPIFKPHNRTKYMILILFKKIPVKQRRLIIQSSSNRAELIWLIIVRLLSHLLGLSKRSGNRSLVTLFLARKAKIFNELKNWEKSWEVIGGPVVFKGSVGKSLRQEKEGHCQGGRKVRGKRYVTRHPILAGLNQNSLKIFPGRPHPNYRNTELECSGPVEIRAK